jgi:predicted nucleic acid-binding protein
MRLIILDTGTLGLLTHPRALPAALACRNWAQGHLLAGVRLIVPGIADYELRRELIRAGRTSGLGRLDAARAGLEFDPVTQAALDKAAELWAAVRTAGLATAHPSALDGDAILAAQTILATGPGDVATIATHNARHLSRFPVIDARPWPLITA